MKRNNSVGYFSAYYRGLECLLDLWPKIREQVPKATLDVYYGWESWVAIQGEDDFYERMERKFTELKDKGVTVHGRVSHTDLAKAMKQIQVWAYPTMFDEIFAITAVKANMAGMKPVITDVAALKETGGPNASRITSRRIYSDEYSQKKFVRAVVESLKNPLSEDEVMKQQEWASQFSWGNIALKWEEAIK